ncbi:virulence RhuM family protein [Bacteroides xylanisolvens]|nr:virulence RhuM family protein [Bacteroides xylanisolvens]MCI5691899.1 virulence RhuM family protein [Bacteroides xylanisolvens]
MTEAVTKHRQLEGTHSVGREVELYNLNMIIVLGYRTCF